MDTREDIEAAIGHGGDLDRARRLFPQAPEPWVDLSTGINPHSYPHSPVPASAFARLPDPGALRRLKEAAARSFGAPSAAHVAAAPGTQMLLPWIAAAALDGGARRGAVLVPAYAEHMRTARMMGLSMTEVERFEDLFASDFAVVVNPKNPDGRVTERAALLSLAGSMRARGGLLVVDEAFIETGCGESVADAAGEGGLVVLRSFGKFYGLAGVRLGFALAQPDLVATLEARLGPWAVSGPALHAAPEALADEAWRTAMRARLKAEAARLDGLLAAAGLEIVGGTSLFRLTRSEGAAALFERLGRAGILVRAFGERPRDLRFGLPADAAAWKRLEDAL